MAPRTQPTAADVISKAKAAFQKMVRHRKEPTHYVNVRDPDAPVRRRDQSLRTEIRENIIKKDYKYVREAKRWYPNHAFALILESELWDVLSRFLCRIDSRDLDTIEEMVCDQYEGVHRSDIKHALEIWDTYKLDELNGMRASIHGVDDIANKKVLHLEDSQSDPTSSYPELATWNPIKHKHQFHPEDRKALWVGMSRSRKCRAWLKIFKQDNVYISEFYDSKFKPESEANLDISWVGNYRLQHFTGDSESEKEESRQTWYISVLADYDAIERIDTECIIDLERAEKLDAGKQPIHEAVRTSTNNGEGSNNDDAILPSIGSPLQHTTATMKSPPPPPRSSSAANIFSKSVIGKRKRGKNSPNDMDSQANRRRKVVTDSPIGSPSVSAGSDFHISSVGKLYLAPGKVHHVFDPDSPLALQVGTSIFDGRSVWLEGFEKDGQHYSKFHNSAGEVKHEVDLDIHWKQEYNLEHFAGDSTGQKRENRRNWYFRVLADNNALQTMPNFVLDTQAAQRPIPGVGLVPVMSPSPEGKDSTDSNAFAQSQGTNDENLASSSTMSSDGLQSEGTPEDRRYAELASWVPQKHNHCFHPMDHKALWVGTSNVDGGRIWLKVVNDGNFEIIKLFDSNFQWTAQNELDFNWLDAYKLDHFAGDFEGDQRLNRAEWYRRMLADHDAVEHVRPDTVVDLDRVRSPDLDPNHIPIGIKSSEAGEATDYEESQSDDTEGLGILPSIECPHQTFVEVTNAQSSPISDGATTNSITGKRNRVNDVTDNAQLRANKKSKLVADSPTTAESISQNSIVPPMDSSYKMGSSPLWTSPRKRSRKWNADDDLPETQLPVAKRARTCSREAGLKPTIAAPAQPPPSFGADEPSLAGIANDTSVGTLLPACPNRISASVISSPGALLNTNDTSQAIANVFQASPKNGAAAPSHRSSTSPIVSQRSSIDLVTSKNMDHEEEEGDDHSITLPPAELSRTEKIANTILRVTNTNKPDEAPVCVSLEQCPNAVCFWFELYRACDVGQQGPISQQFATATFPWNKNKQCLRKDDYHDYKVFLDTIVRGWTNEPKKFKREGCEVDLLVRVNGGR